MSKKIKKNDDELITNNSEFDTPLITEDFKQEFDTNTTLITDSKINRPYDHFSNLYGKSFNVSYRGKMIYESNKGGQFSVSGDDVIINGIRYNKNQLSLNIF